MLLFFDTETTGMVDRYLPPDHEHQPHMVQIAALLTDDDGAEVSSINLVVCPGVPVPVQASNIHGITDEIAKHKGITPHCAAAAFYGLSCRADTLVAHNIDFDVIVVSAQLSRLGKPEHCKEIGRLPTFCTMKAATPICQIPHTNPRSATDYKWPKLEEAFRHFFGRELEGAHDALVDVRACRDVYFALKDLEKAA